MEAISHMCRLKSKAHKTKRETIELMAAKIQNTFKIYIRSSVSIEWYFPANQHFFSPNLGRNTASCRLFGKLSNIAAMPVMINGTPQA